MGRVNLKQFQDKSTDSDKSVESEVENSLKISVVTSSVMEKSEKPTIAEKPIASKKPKKAKKSTKPKINADSFENKKREASEIFDYEQVPIETRYKLRKVLRGQYRQYRTKSEIRVETILELWEDFKLDNLPERKIPKGLQNNGEEE